MSIFDDWPLVIDEARDRLMEGIANDVDDVVAQLVDEGICQSMFADNLKHDLDAHR